jgi:NAD+ synthase
MQLHLTDCLATKNRWSNISAYDELEWAMIQDQEGKSATDFLIEKNSLRNIQRLNKINQHKMKSIPICIVKINGLLSE